MPDNLWQWEAAKAAKRDLDAMILACSMDISILADPKQRHATEIYAALADAAEQARLFAEKLLATAHDYASLCLAGYSPQPEDYRKKKSEDRSQKERSEQTAIETGDE